MSRSDQLSAAAEDESGSSSAASEIYSVGSLAKANDLRLAEVPIHSSQQFLLEQPEKRPTETTPGASSFARQAHLAGRVLAASVPLAEREKLFLEHAQLVEKKLCEGLSKRETTRLAYVRWQLSTIEDAEVGPSLGAYRRLADVHDRLADEVEAFAEHVNKLVSRHDRTPKRR